MHNIYRNFIFLNPVNACWTLRIDFLFTAILFSAIEWVRHRSQIIIIFFLGQLKPALAQIVILSAGFTTQDSQRVSSSIEQLRPLGPMMPQLRRRTTRRREVESSWWRPNCHGSAHRADNGGTNGASIEPDDGPSATCTRLPRLGVNSGSSRFFGLLHGRGGVTVGGLGSAKRR